MGANNVNQLGQGSTTLGFSSTPLSVPGLPNNLKQITAGSGAHATALACDGSVWTWGLNNCGQLGQGGAVSSCGYPICATDGIARQNGLNNGSSQSCSYCNSWGNVGMVSGLPAISYVAGGNLATYAVASIGGSVWAWGVNEAGQLGDGTLVNRSTPVQVTKCSGGILTNIVQISSGDQSVYALDASGNVWSWGMNSNGSGALGYDCPHPTSYSPFSKGQELGRSTGCNLAGEKNSCAGLVQADYNGDGIADGPLVNIVQVTAGDTHGLAIDASGTLWAWGNDYIGQTGNGSSSWPYCGTCGGGFVSYASKVVLPGNTTVMGNTPTCGAYSNTAATNFIGSSLKASFIAAGQQSSAVVLNNGQVVTFGSNAQSGLTGAPTCNFGTLGIGSTATGLSIATAQFVLTSAGNPLKHIVSLSRADGWYFAQDSIGNVYGWGVNNVGQLGISGNTTCQQYAVPITLPSGCSYVFPCPNKPTLGGDISRCANFTPYVFSGIGVTAAPSYTFTWQYRATTTSGWTLLSSGSGTAFTTAVGANIGQYRVLVSDNRSNTSILCGKCPTVGDTLNIFPIGAPNYFDPGTSIICSTIPGSGFFQVSTTVASGQIFQWYTDPTTPNTLNTVTGITISPTTSGLNISGVSWSQTSTLAGCPGRVLYVQDVSSIQGTLLPPSAIATATCSSGSYSQGNYTTSNPSNGSPILIQVNSTVNLNSVNFFQYNYGNSSTDIYHLAIFVNTVTSSVYCPSCSPSGNYDGPTGADLNTAGGTQTFTIATSAPPALRTLTTNLSLPAGKYWLIVTGGNLLTFKCSTPAKGATGQWSTPFLDNTGSNYVRGITSIYQGQNQNSDGLSHLFNIVFSAGTPYSCSRLPICAVTTCVLSVSYADISATKVNNTVVVSWSTFSEQNASHFVVERSYDGVTFQAIGTVGANGTSSNFNNYSFIDTKPGRGTVYYRLIEYDLDNSYHVSRIVSVNLTSLTDFTIIPNPNNGNFTIQANLNSPSSFTIQITNSLGVVISSTLENSSGAFSKDFDFSSLSAGIYFVSFKAGDDIIVKKVVIEK